MPSPKTKPRTRFCDLPSAITEQSTDAFEIPLIERLWSYITRNHLFDIDALQSSFKNDHFLAISIDLIELIEADYELGTFVFSSPGTPPFLSCYQTSSVDDIQNRLANFLRELKLITIQDRVWLRLQNVPLPLSNAESVVNGWWGEGVQKRLFHVCGIISSLSRIRPSIHCRKLRCVYCNESIWNLSSNNDTLSEPCCPEQIMKPKFEEHKPSRVTLPTQDIRVTVIDIDSHEKRELNGAFTTEFGFHAESIQTTLFDDLAGSFQLGDIVHGYVLIQPTVNFQAQSKTYGHLTTVEMRCLNMERLNSFEMCHPFNRRLSWLHGDGGLEAICKMMQKAFPLLHPPTFLIAALLSGVQIGHPNEHGRDQIHILLTCHGYDSFTSTMLYETAKILSPINDHFDFDSQFLMDDVQSNARIGKPEDTTIAAGYLTLSRMGISILELERISKSENTKWTRCLNSDSTAALGMEFRHPVTTTLWGTSPSLHETNKTPSIYASFSDLFDLVIPYSVEHDPLYDGFVVKRLLRKKEEADQKDAKALLRSAMCKASKMKRPYFSKSAKRLLQGYYAYIRNPRDFGEIISSKTVPVDTFQTLLRLSTASAKLTLSPVIRSVPDVTLAIKLTEETLFERGIYGTASRLQLNMESISERCQYPSLDSELRAIHKMLNKTLFVKDMTAEE